MVFHSCQRVLGIHSFIASLQSLNLTVVGLDNGLEQVLLDRMQVRCGQEPPERSPTALLSEDVSSDEDMARLMHSKS